MSGTISNHKGEGRNSKQSQFEVFGSWRTGELLDLQLSARLMNGENVRIKGWDADFDKTHGAIRLSRDIEDVPLNIKIKLERNIVTSINLYSATDRPEFAGFILELEALGIFRPGSAAKLGFSSSELSAGRRAIWETKNLERINISDVSSLKSSSEYAGNKTVLVLQDEAVIMESGKGVNGLYTFGAGTCSILIAASKDLEDTVKNVGMAHIDAMIQTNRITQFLSMVKQDDNLEVYVIGGSKITSLHIIEGCRLIDAQIKFFCANLNESRLDDAIVDSQGVVYYGERKDLAALSNIESNNQKMRIPGSQAQHDSVELSIRTI